MDIFCSQCSKCVFPHSPNQVFKWEPFLPPHLSSLLWSLGLQDEIFKTQKTAWERLAISFSPHLFQMNFIFQCKHVENTQKPSWCKCINWKILIAIHCYDFSVTGYRTRFICRILWPFCISISYCIQRRYVNQITDFLSPYLLVHIQIPHWVEVQMQQKVSLVALPLVSLLRDLNWIVRGQRDLCSQQWTGMNRGKWWQTTW